MAPQIKVLASQKRYLAAKTTRKYRQGQERQAPQWVYQQNADRHVTRDTCDRLRRDVARPGPYQDAGRHFPAQADLAASDLNRHDARRGLVLQHRPLRANDQTAIAEVAKKIGRPIRHTQQHEWGLRGALRQRGSFPGPHLAIGVGNGVSVRVAVGMPQVFVDSGHQSVGNRVLQVFGLLMHFIPREPQGIGEVQFKQAMVAHHADRHFLAFLGEADALMRRILHQPRFGEPLKHQRNAARRDLQAASQFAGGGTARGVGQLVDCLEIVLYRDTLHPHPLQGLYFDLGRSILVCRYILLIRSILLSRSILYYTVS